MRGWVGLEMGKGLLRVDLARGRRTADPSASLRDDKKERVVVGRGPLPTESGC